MAFDLFEKEQAVIDNAKALLGDGGIVDEAVAREFGDLIKAYEKLFKSTRRLIRGTSKNW